MIPFSKTIISFSFLPAEQVAFTNVQVCSDITSCYPEGFPLPSAFQGCPYTLSALRAIRTESALSRQEQVALTLIIALKNEYNLGRTSSHSLAYPPFTRLYGGQIFSTYPFLVLCAQEREACGSHLGPSCNPSFPSPHEDRAT